MFGISSFQSTRSPRRETIDRHLRVLLDIFQSTPSPRRETVRSACAIIYNSISIHSLPKEGDLFGDTLNPYFKISIHSLPKEGDKRSFPKPNCSCNFNPLPPQGGRRTAGAVRLGSRAYFNPLPPQGGRLSRLITWVFDIVFQSTPSPRRETWVYYVLQQGQGISIHSLPKEGDNCTTFRSTGTANFNPLPPQGGRHQDLQRFADLLDISIHSLPKEGDARQRRKRRLRPISIHSLPKEGD